MGQFKEMAIALEEARAHAQALEARERELANTLAACSYIIFRMHQLYGLYWLRDELAGHAGFDVVDAVAREGIRLLGGAGNEFSATAKAAGWNVLRPGSASSSDCLGPIEWRA
jgi:hypothetical protein